MIELIDSLDVGNELGEGVIWDHQSQRVWWTDIQRSMLYRYDPVSNELEHWSTPERLACFAPIAGETRLLAAFESGYAFYTPESGALDWIKKIETDNPGTRFNDGRTDRQGRLWAGTMVENTEQATSQGSLYCLHADLSVTQGFGQLSIPNSLCWSPDGTTMYHTDTPTRVINQYPYDPLTGGIGEPQLLLKTQAGCFPDGSIVDSEGYLWNAQWGASQVVRYSPLGEQNLVLPVPASQPSCVAFAGENLDLLVVTSAQQGLSSPSAHEGNVFIYQTDHRGLAEQPFKLGG